MAQRRSHIQSLTGRKVLCSLLVWSHGERPPLQDTVLAPKSSISYRGQIASVEPPMQRKGAASRGKSPFTMLEVVLMCRHISTCRYYSVLTNMLSRVRTRHGIRSKRR